MAMAASFDPEDQFDRAQRRVGLTRKSTHFAVVTLFITLLLLFLLRLTPVWEIQMGPEPARDSEGAEDSEVETNSRANLPEIDKTQPPPTPMQAAVILETRPLQNLLPIILHFSSVLGPNWPIHIYTSPENRNRFKESPAFNRKVYFGQIKVNNLPPDMEDDYAFHDPYYRSHFLTQKWIWDELAPAEHVLIFQADSIVCANSEYSLEDFVEYDFIGAPAEAVKDQVRGVSGDLSLRNRRIMLGIATNWDWESEMYEMLDKRGLAAKDPSSFEYFQYEDLWFWMKMKKFPDPGDWTRTANLPTMEIAQTFALGETAGDRPLGYRHAHTWLGNKTEEILKWCPEYSMAMLAGFSLN